MWKQQHYQHKRSGHAQKLPWILSTVFGQKWLIDSYQTDSWGKHAELIISVHRQSIWIISPLIICVILPFLHPSHLKHVKIKCFQKWFSTQTVTETTDIKIFYSRLRSFQDILKLAVSTGNFTVCLSSWVLKIFVLIITGCFRFAPHSNSRNLMTHSTSLREHWPKAWGLWISPQTFLLCCLLSLNAVFDF